MSAGAGLPAPAGSRPEAIKAIPVRHWGRWISAVVVIYLVVALIYSFAKNPIIDWPTVGSYLFKPLVLHGVVLTIELTFVCMVVGAVGGTILAVMRLSTNPVLSTIAWVYIWFFRGTPVYVQIILWGNIGVLWQQVLRRPALHRPVARLDLSGPLDNSLVRGRRCWPWA